MFSLGLDVSLSKTAVSVADREGVVLWQARFGLAASCSGFGGYGAARPRLWPAGADGARHAPH